MGYYDEWVKHEVPHLEAMAENTSLPGWLRLHYLAMARMRSDGHAHFERGELADALGKVNAGGELIPADRHNVQRAIRAARKHNVLAEESCTTCLVVPRDVAWKGKFRHLPSACTRHRAASNVGHQVCREPAECGSPDDPNVGHQMDTLPRQENGPEVLPLDSSTTAPDSDTQPPAPPAVDVQQAPLTTGRALELDGENSQSQSLTTGTGETPTWQPKDHHQQQAAALGFPVDMERVTSRFMNYHGHKHPAALDGLFTQWIAREKDTRPDWRKQQDAAREHADNFWSQQVNDNHDTNHDTNRDPVAVGSILEHLPIAGRKHIAAARARRARAEQALRTDIARAQSA